MTADAQQAWYVYALAPADAPVPLAGGILPDAVVSRMPMGDFVAFASRVARHLFDRDDPANRTEDPAWLAERVQAHHAVNTAASAAGPCLPLAFATLFSSLDLLRDFVAQNRSRLSAALRQVAEQVEWTLSLTEDPATHAAWLEPRTPELQALARAAATAGEGTAFLMSKRLDKLRRAARQTHLKLVADQLAGELAGAGVPLLPEAPRHGLPAWTLLAPRRETKGPALLSRLADDMSSSGLSLRLTGPWPPYGFTHAALAGEHTHV